MTPERWMALSVAVPLTIWYCLCAVVAFRVGYDTIGWCSIAAAVVSVGYLVRRWGQT